METWFCASVIKLQKKKKRNEQKGGTHCTFGVWKHGAWFSGVKGCWTGPALCGATAEEDASGPLLTTGVIKLRRRQKSGTGVSFLFIPRCNIKSAGLCGTWKIPVGRGVPVVVWSLANSLWVLSGWTMKGRSREWLLHSRNRSWFRRCCALILRKKLYNILWESRIRIAAGQTKGRSFSFILTSLFFCIIIFV